MRRLEATMSDVPEGYVPCSECRGGTRNVECSNCDGEGIYYDVEAGKARSCQSCDGEGTVDSSECPHCIDGVMLED